MHAGAHPGARRQVREPGVPGVLGQLAQQLEHLLGEPAGVPDEPVRGGRAEVEAEELPGRGPDLLRPEGLEGEALDLVAGEEVQHPRRDVPRLRRVEGQHEHDPLAVHPAHHEHQDPQGLLVQPVGVVDGDHHAAAGLQALEVGAQGGGVVHGLRGAQLRDRGRGRRGLAVEAPGGAQGRGEHELAVPGQGELGLPLVAGGAEHADAARGGAAVVEEQLEQGRLARAQRALEHHGADVALAHGPQDLEELLERGRPPDQRELLAGFSVLQARRHGRESTRGGGAATAAGVRPETAQPRSPPATGRTLPVT